MLNHSSHLGRRNSEKLNMKSCTLRYLLSTPACLTIFSFYIHQRALNRSCSLNYFLCLYTPAHLIHPAHLLESNELHNSLPLSLLKLQTNQKVIFDCLSHIITNIDISILSNNLSGLDTLICIY